jgi:hypothetical protein
MMPEQLVKKKEDLKIFQVRGSDMKWRYVTAENSRKACEQIKEICGSVTDDINTYNCIEF